MERIGLPEAILCEGKDISTLKSLVDELGSIADKPTLLTRMSVQQFEAVSHANLDYDPLSRTAFLNGCHAAAAGRVSIVTAGTADLAVAGEAGRTLNFLGFEARLFADVGVAGLWRLLDVLDEVKEGRVVIVVAGMDAALASVIGGLVAAPVIAVPTSVGYGVARRGESALHAMLASCAQGVAVMNIDNGFGAACAAVRILNAGSPS